MRRFAVVGLIATVVDVGLAVALLDRGWSVVTADVVALVAAAVVAVPSTGSSPCATTPSPGGSGFDGSSSPWWWPLG